jgi:hypothetical protein
MRTVKAWAIVHSGDELDLFDERCPVYWLRRIAKKEAFQRSFKDSRVVRVEIREVKPKRKRAGGEG